MDELYKDLPADVAASIANTLSAQHQLMLEKVAELDWKLTQHNSFINAGGAVATLTYMGSVGSSEAFALPLICFLIGLIASGLEIRFMLKVFHRLHKDAIHRSAGFIDNTLSVRNSVPAKNAGGAWVHLNHLFGWISQSAFILGVISGIWFFYQQAT